MIPNHVIASGRYSVLAGHYAWDAPTLSALGWPAANRALYVPIIMPEAFTIARFFSSNNSVTGNDDVGIYDESGTKLLSTGSQARTAALDYYDVADTTFAAGRYYLAESHNNTGQHFRVAYPIITLRALGVLQEAAFPLPTTMTPAAIATAYFPFFGFTQSAVY